ncbi:MAG: histidine phosphatase family protein [Moraxella sp.]|nr:histidine phosphatase family protein [Moraxella sp.]
MQLILMRHAEAGPYVPDDAHRKLTERGHTQAADSAGKLVGLYRPQLLIVSPYDRARQTANHVLDAYAKLNHAIRTVVCDNITPDDDPVQGLNEIYRIHESHGSPDGVLVVCHMPIVARMAQLLTGAYHDDGFALAEFRAYQTEYIAEGLARQIQQYHP